MAEHCGGLFGDDLSSQVREERDMSLPFRPSSLRFLVVWGALSAATFGPIATPVRAQNAEDSSFSRCDQTKTLQDYWEELRANPRSSLANYCEGELLLFDRNYQASVNAYRSSLRGDGDAKWTKVWSYIEMGKIFDITRSLLVFEAGEIARNGCGRVVGDTSLCRPFACRVRPPFTVRPMASKSVNRSCSSDYGARMHNTARNEVLLTGLYRNLPSFNDNCVATLHDEHVFIKFMPVLGRYSILHTRPKCHLASLYPVKNVTLDTGCGLICAGDSVGRVLHEPRKSIHETGC
jgi:hypothetical protein